MKKGQRMGFNSTNVALDHFKQTIRANRLDKTGQVHGVVMRAFRVELTHTWHSVTNQYYTPQF